MFGINLDGLDDLDDLDNGDVIDEVITNPLDSLDFDEEPDWNAADNFLESIRNSLLAVLLATPVGMLVAFSLWTIYILLNKAIISLSGHTTTAQVAQNMEMADFRDLGRVFGTPNDLPTTESTSTSAETPVQVPISESPPNQSPSEISKFGSFKSTKSSIASFKSSKDSNHDQG